MIELQLPYPPSLNRYWRHVRGRVVLSGGGRKYQADVKQILESKKIRQLRSRLDVLIIMRPPDNRKRDVDNIPKAILDSLQNGGLMQDDCQVDRLTIVRDDPIPGGGVSVMVRAFRKKKLKAW